MGKEKKKKTPGRAETRLAAKSGFWDKYSPLAVGVAAGLYILFFSVISILRYQSFDFNDFDLAIYGQVCRNILQGSLFSSILGLNFLGNHLDLILFPLIPIYALFPGPQTLLVIQTVFLGAAVLPLYLLAQKFLDRRWAFLVSFAYLTYPPLHYLNLYEFHPLSLVIFFLLFTLYYFEEKKFIPFLVFLFLSLLCKEDISLAGLFLSLYALIRRYPAKWVVFPGILAVFWFGLVLFMVPRLNPGLIKFTSLYSHLGATIPEIFAHILKNPIDTLGLIFTRDNLRFISQLFGPVAFLSFFSPLALLPSLPLFLEEMLTLAPTHHTINYHYAAKLIPFIFFAGLLGIKKLLRLKVFSQRPLVIAGLLVSGVLVSNLIFGLFPKLPARLSRNFLKSPLDFKKEELVARIPKDAPAVSTFEFLPKLSQRSEIYSFHHVYTGCYTLSDKRYTLPESVGYALVDFDDHLTFTVFYRPEQYRNIRNFLNDGWGLVDAADNVCLFRKGLTSEKKIWEKIERFPEGVVPALRIEGNIILGYRVGAFEPGPAPTCSKPGVVPLELFWQCSHKTDQEFGVLVKVLDESGKVVHQFTHPAGYRAFPSYTWEEEGVWKERCWVFLPGQIGKTYTLKLTVYDTMNRKGVSMEVNNAKLLDQEGYLDLGKVGG